MANNFSANIMLCKEITDGNKFEDVFNDLTVENDEVINFDIAIFFSNDIEETCEEMFLLDMVFENDEEIKYRPIGTFKKQFNILGKNGDASALNSVEVNFPWEGIYRIELRKCNGYVDINNLSDGEIMDLIDDSSLINHFTFNVDKKN